MVQTQAVQHVYDGTTEGNTLPVDEFDLVTLLCAAWKANNRCFKSVPLLCSEGGGSRRGTRLCAFLLAGWTVTLMVHGSADVDLIKACHHGTCRRGIENKAHLPQSRQWTRSCWQIESQPRISRGYDRLSCDKKTQVSGDWVIAEALSMIEGKGVNYTLLASSVAPQNLIYIYHTCLGVIQSWAKSLPEVKDWHCLTNIPFPW